jgi:hypothetical protein
MTNTGLIELIKKKKKNSTQLKEKICPNFIIVIYSTINQNNIFKDSSSFFFSYNINAFCVNREYFKSIEKSIVILYNDL